MSSNLQRASVATKRFILKQTSRRPLIMPVMLEV